jgi:hypothetical protein
MALVAAACADDPVAGNSFHRTMMAGEGGLSQQSIAWRRGHEWRRKCISLPTCPPR